MKEQDISRIELALDLLAIRTDIESVKTTTSNTQLRVNNIQKTLAIEEKRSELLEHGSDPDAAEYLEVLREGIFIHEQGYAALTVIAAQSEAVRRQSMADNIMKILAMQSKSVENSEAMKYATLQDKFIEDCDIWLKEVDSVESPQSQQFLPILVKVSEARNDQAEESNQQLAKVIEEADKLRELLEADKNRTKGLASVFQILAGIAFVTGSILGITAQLRSERTSLPATHGEVSELIPEAADKTVS